MKFLKLLFFFLIFKGMCVNGQQKEFIFKNLTQEDGLPSNETYYIFEDSRHYLWIATDLGVVRYNGNKFEVFNLPDNVVFKIKEDTKGRIWFFTHKAQLAYFENEKIHSYRYNDIILKRIPRINIVDAYVDEEQNIILSQSSDSTYEIDSRGIITGNYMRRNLPSSREFSINVLNNNTCFTKENKGPTDVGDIILLSINNNQNKFSYSVHVRHIPFQHYGSIYLKKNIYFFGGKTLVRLMENGAFKTIQMPNEILCLKADKDNIWIGMMKNGAILLNRDLSKKISDTLLQDKSVTSINMDSEGGIYFSTLENGIYYIKNSNIRTLNIKQNDANKSISRIMSLNDTSLIYSNSSGLYLLTQNKTKQLLTINNYNISDLILDKKKLYCFGAFFDFILKIKKANEKEINFYYLLRTPSEAIKLSNDTIICSQPGNVMVYKSAFLNNPRKSTTTDNGYATHAKLIVNKQLKLFKTIDNVVWGGGTDGLYKTNVTYDTMSPFKSASPLLQKGISCIRQMDNGVLVTGIRFGGIALIKDTNIFANITEHDGLLSNKIRYLLPLKNDLWVATAKGVSVIRFSSYNPLQYKIINIGKNDGFYNITINQLIQFQRKIVAATSNGVYFIENPEEILSRKLPAIPFYINSINYYKGDTSGINKITLPYSKNRILIKYNAVCFNSPEEVKYIYRFQPTDSSWQRTSNTELLLENLEPGSYNLQIKAVVPSQNRSSALLNFKITVDKPWWQNNWFRLLLLSIVAGGIYFYVANRIKTIRNKEKRKTELNTKIAELEQTALRSQMNPHFIFNCLTSIQQLIVTGNKTDANEYLVKFARLIRKTLDLSAIPFISIREEIEYLGDYIFLEELRLSGQFNYTITTGNNIDIDRTRIPNMMIQPVVENCIRHGIKPMENKKGFIDIRFENKGENIVCTITDNGVGRNHSISTDSNTFTKHKSYGIDIIEKRLKAFAEFNENDFGIQINDLENDDGSPSGTQVIIQLPFKTNL